MRIAILDDYQHAAAQCADWSRVGKADVRFFHEPFANADAVAQALAGFDVVVAMRERTRFDAALLERLPELRLLVSTGMRNAAIDLDACTARGIVVCGTSSNPLLAAEHAWAMIAALFKGIVANDTATRSGAWQTMLGRSLAGATLGVLGLGRLGGALARYGQAFDMRVIAWSPHLTEARCREHGVSFVERDALFAEADVLSVHMVLSPATRGIVGAREIGLMRPDAFLVNTSRGGLVDEAALCAALARGHLAGAALDVFETEPLPPDAPVLRAPRTLLSPHMGYVTWQNYRQYYGDALEDILAWQAGAPVRLLT